MSLLGLKEGHVRLRVSLALFLVTFFLISHFSMLISHASSASTHGCAPLVPPPVPGSALPAPAIPGKLLINEVLSLPGSRWNCSEQKNTYSITSDAWVELYNPQSQPYNLYTAHATFEIGSSTMPFYLPLGSVIATQTVWSSLQFPTSVVIETPATKPTAAYPSPLSPPVNDGWDTPHRILITTLIVALALMLFWCWRLFISS